MTDGLCSLCAGLDIHGAIRRLLTEEADQSGASVPLESPWHSTLADVERSSSSCALCAVIMMGWQSSREVVVEQAIRDAMFDPQDPPPGLNEPITQIPAYRDAFGVSLALVQRARTVDDGRGNKSSLFLQVRCGPAVRTSFDVLDPVTAELRIVRETPAPTALDEVGSVSAQLDPHTDLLVHTNPLSLDSLGIARGWLQTCVNSHGSACSPGALDPEQWMPTRLLEVVSESGKVYLRESRTLTPSGDARYVALSHCWGQGGTPFTTTHDTRPLRMGGIDVEAMPQTFQDAVTLTESLGLRYLWIDSLCIIQDDADDWAWEAAQMAQVYRSAHLVLNAANSDADNAGFLGYRDIPNTVRFSPSTPGQQRLCLQLQPPEGRRWWDPTGPDHLAAEPISSRAWCLQERTLPVRALQYGTHQAFWECESMRASEDGDVIPQAGGRLKRLCKTGNITTNTVFARADRDPASEREQEVNWVGWYKMVEDYSARSITKHTDRLPALSGLAHAAGRATGDEYLAGLWKSGLLEGLLWCKARPDQALTATPEYVAPSWSWASVVGPVQFPIYTWYTDRAFWKAKMADFEPLAEYVGHSTVKRDLDPYGRLEGGYLSLKASLLPVVSVRKRQSEAPVLHGLFGQEPARSEVADIAIQLKTGSRNIWIEGGFDDPDTAADCGELFVVFITRLPHVLEEGFVEHRFGLILERVGRGSPYRRVGFVDGVVLKKSLLDAVRGRGMFSIVGYPRAHEEGDIYDVTRDNDLASDPLNLPRVELTMC